MNEQRSRNLALLITGILSLIMVSLSLLLIQIDIGRAGIPYYRIYYHDLIAPAIVFVAFGVLILLSLSRPKFYLVLTLFELAVFAYAYHQGLLNSGWVDMRTLIRQSFGIDLLNSHVFRYNIVVWVASVAFLLPNLLYYLARAAREPKKGLRARKIAALLIIPALAAVMIATNPSKFEFTRWTETRYGDLPQNSTSPDSMLIFNSATYKLTVEYDLLICSVYAIKDESIAVNAPRLTIGLFGTLFIPLSK